MTLGIGDSTRESANRVLTVVLAVALVAALGGVVYVAQTPGAQEDPFTEFYSLGPGGEAAEYPTDLATGETGEFVVGITNNEHRQLAYTVALVVDGEVLEERTASVANGATWEDSFEIGFDDPGEKRLEILLFRGEEAGALDDPYQELRLIVEVRE